MLTMQNAWEIQHADTIERTNFETSHNARADSNTNANNNNNTVMNNSQGLTFGELMERSLSAPPLRNDMNESLGSIRSGSGRTQLEGHQLLFGIREGADTSSRPREGGSFLQEGVRVSEDASPYLSRSLHEHRANAFSSSSQNNPKLQSRDALNLHNFNSTINSNQNINKETSNGSSLGQRTMGFNLDFSRDDTVSTDYEAQMRRQLQRSHSAAPQINQRPPPGMNSNDIATSAMPMASSVHGFLMDPSKRPASTGVIGDTNHAVNSTSSLLGSLRLSPPPTSNHHQQTYQQNNVHRGGNNDVPSTSLGVSAIRPAAKTLMDLIQEDFPKTPSPNFFSNTELQQSRPKSVSPPRSSNFLVPSEHNVDAVLNNSMSQSNIDTNRGMQVQNQNNSYLNVNKVHTVYKKEDSNDADIMSDKNNVASTPQYVTIPVSHLQHHQGGPQAMSQGNPTMYSTGVHMPRIQNQSSHHPSPYEVPAQAVYYNAQQQPSHQPHQNQQSQQMHQELSNGSSSDQIFHPHPTMLVNTSTPYYTVQYTGHPPPPTMHHGPPHHLQNHQQPEYISVVPVHHHPHMATSIPANGSYAYYPHPHAPHGPPPPQMVNVNATVIRGSPMASQNPHSVSMTSMSSSSLSSTRRSKAGNVGKSPADKNQKKKGNRRGPGGGGDLGFSKGARGVGGLNANHSPLLEDFRNSKNRSWTVLDILGHVVEFCQDQNGSRFIQQRLEVADTTEKELVMNEVLPAVSVLRNDVFGNYVVQKLLEHGSDNMKASLRDTLIREMLPLSLQMYGCRVVQKSLETLSDKEIFPLLAEFHGNVIACIHDQNGNHVMQKCIEVMSTKAKRARSNGSMYSAQIDFIIKDVLSNVEALSCHPYGCRVLQRMLEHCVDEQRVKVLDQVKSSHRVLLDDQYGNYVIQHVLQFGRSSDRDSILEIVIENGLLSMSRQKFASNVVEKLLKYGSSSQRNAIVREMLKPPKENDSEIGNHSIVLLMVRDAYANYVVQTTLDVVPEGTERRDLLEELNKNAAQLRNYTFAKHIVAKLSTF